MQTVVETEFYLRDARATGLSDDERRGIVDFIAANPNAGHEIPGTGARARFALPEGEKAKAAATGLSLFTAGKIFPCFC